MGYIKKAGGLSRSQMLLDDPLWILNRHFPTTKLDHFGTQVNMAVIKNSFQQFFHEICSLCRLCYHLAPSVISKLIHWDVSFAHKMQDSRIQGVKGSSRKLDHFNGARHRDTSTAAECCQAQAVTSFSHGVNQGHHDSGAGCADRVPETDSGSVYIGDISV